MDCGIVSDFVLDSMIRIWENCSKISGLRDPFVIFQITAIQGGGGKDRVKDSEEKTCGKGEERLG